LWYVRLNSVVAQGQPANALYSLKVTVPSRAHVRFAGKTADGTWKRLQTIDCENNDETSGPAGAQAQQESKRTCLVHAPGVVKFAVLTRDVLIPADVDLPGAGVEGINEFFSTFDECGVPRDGETIECFNDGTPAACEPLRGTCAADGDCCTGLTCQSGACAPPPACSTLRGACTTTSDCCTGLACTSGLCE
jgi:hypothetical protein